MSERRACRTIGMSRSTLRYETEPQDPTDLRTRLRELAQARPRFGYRRLRTAAARRPASQSQTVYRLYRQKGLSVRRRQRKRVARGRGTEIPSSIVAAVAPRYRLTLARGARVSPVPSRYARGRRSPCWLHRPHEKSMSEYRAGEIPQQVYTALRHSGFPFQTAVADIVQQSRPWELSTVEYPWTDASGNDQFLDLTDSTHRLETYCGEYQVLPSSYESAFCVVATPAVARAVSRVASRSRGPPSPTRSRMISRSSSANAPAM